MTHFLPIGVILYGTVILGMRPPVLPLVAGLALAALMCLAAGHKWDDLQEGMVEALGRIQIVIAILVLVGMLIGAWMASGTSLAPHSTMTIALRAGWRCHNWVAPSAKPRTTCRADCACSRRGPRQLPAAPRTAPAIHRPPARRAPRSC